MSDAKRQRRRSLGCCWGIALLGLCLGGVEVAQARVFSVAVAGSSCSRARCDCTPTTPCALTPALYRQLAPGDTVRLGSGVYPAQRLEGVRGRRGMPVVIEGASTPDGRAATIFRAGADVRDTLELRQCEHVELRQLTIEGAGRAGVWVNNSHHVVVRDSLIRDNGTWGVFSNHANQLTVVDNRIIGPASQHGVYYSNSGDGGSIEDNLIVGFLGSGVQLNGDKRMGGADGVIGDGVIQDVTIARNYIAGNGASGGAAVNLDGARGVKVQDNIIVDNASAAITLFRGDGAVASREVRVERNLIAGDAGARAIIIFGEGARDNLLADNWVLSLGAEAPVLRIDQADAPGWFDRGRRGAPLPAAFIANRYHSPRHLAMIGDARLSALEDWVERSSDSSSAMLPLDVRGSGTAPAALYRHLAEQVRSSQLLRGNRFIGELERFGEGAADER